MSCLKHQSLGVEQNDSFELIADTLAREANLYLPMEWTDRNFVDLLKALLGGDFLFISLDDTLASLDLSPSLNPTIAGPSRDTSGTSTPETFQNQYDVEKCEKIPCKFCRKCELRLCSQHEQTHESHHRLEDILADENM